MADCWTGLAGVLSVNLKCAKQFSGVHSEDTSHPMIGHGKISTVFVDPQATKGRERGRIKKYPKLLWDQRKILHGIIFSEDLCSRRCHFPGSWKGSLIRMTNLVKKGHQTTFDASFLVMNTELEIMHCCQESLRGSGEKCCSISDDIAVKRDIY